MQHTAVSVYNTPEYFQAGNEKCFDMSSVEPIYFLFLSESKGCLVVWMRGQEPTSTKPNPTKKYRETNGLPRDLWVIWIG